MLNEPLSKLATRTVLWSVFFLICFGLGYPTLNRYDPGKANPDAAEYSKMVRGNGNVVIHFRHRVLVPYLARPVFRAALGKVGSWDPAYFALLIVNSFFVSATAFVLFVVVSAEMGSPQIGLLSSTIYLLNFAVPNLLLAGLADSGEGFFLILLVWALSAEWWALLPFIFAVGPLAKETFLPFALVFAVTWVLMDKKALGKPAVAWIVVAGLAGAVSLTAALTLANGRPFFPWSYAGMLRSSAASAGNVLAVLADRDFWLVFAWLLPLGLFRVKRLPREWVMASFTTALIAIAFTAYHNNAGDAGPAVARPIFSIAGPLLSAAVALLVVDLAGGDMATATERVFLQRMVEEGRNPILKFSHLAGLGRIVLNGDPCAAMRACRFHDEDMAQRRYEKVLLPALRTFEAESVLLEDEFTVHRRLETKMP